MFASRDGEERSGMTVRLCPAPTLYRINIDFCADDQGTLEYCSPESFDVDPGGRLRDQGREGDMWALGQFHTILQTAPGRALLRFETSRDGAAQGAFPQAAVLADRGSRLSVPSSSSGSLP